MRRLHLSGRQGFRRAPGKFSLFVLVCLFSAVLAVWFVPVSSAHNSLVAVSLDCNGTASYTANAWAGPTSASRTNTDVRVFESTDNGATWVQVGQGQFNQANGFSFAGTFSIGSSTSVRLKVQEFANWGDGVKPGSPGSASATAPSSCSPATTTTAPTTTTTTTTTAPTATAPTPTATTTAPTSTTAATTAPTATTAVPAVTTTAPATTSPPAATTATAATAAGGVLGASAKKHTAKAKKVTATAKVAHAVVARSSFTG
jgi:hypothetical protein